MLQRSTYLTPEGRVRLEAELEHLRVVRRREVADRIQKAKEIGGTVDNAEYDEAKNEQSFIEGRIQAVEAIIQSAILIPNHKTPAELVEVGRRVTIENDQGRRQTFVIVGSTEASPAEGKISNESPVGKALLGHRPGEVAEVRTPSGVVKLKVLQIE